MYLFPHPFFLNFLSVGYILKNNSNKNPNQSGMNFLFLLKQKIYRICAVESLVRFNFTCNSVQFQRIVIFESINLRIRWIENSLLRKEKLKIKVESKTNLTINLEVRTTVKRKTWILRISIELMNWCKLCKQLIWILDHSRSSSRSPVYCQLF